MALRPAMDVRNTPTQLVLHGRQSVNIWSGTTSTSHNLTVPLFILQTVWSIERPNELVATSWSLRLLHVV